MSGSKSKPVALDGTTKPPGAVVAGLLGRFLQSIFETLYGSLVLFGLAVQMFKLSKRFRVMDDLDKKELASGRSSSLAQV